jgi:hypothetical protein
MDVQAKPSAATEPQVVPSYEAPRIEMILTAEELEREVLYAGAQTRT